MSADVAEGMAEKCSLIEANEETDDGLEMQFHHSQLYTCYIVLDDTYFQFPRFSFALTAIPNIDMCIGMLHGHGIQQQLPSLHKVDQHNLLFF